MNTNSVKFTRVNYQDSSFTGKKLTEYRAKAKGEGITLQQENAFKMLCYNYKVTITVPENKADASDKLTRLYGLSKLNKLERRTDIPVGAKVVILDGKYVLCTTKAKEDMVAPAKDYVELKGVKVPNVLKKFMK